MSLTLGTPLPRKPIAWFWVAVFALPAAYFAYGAAVNYESWVLPAILAAIALLFVLEPYFRRRESETVEVNEDGVVQLERGSRTEVRWADISEIGILTTSDGPFAEDVFFVLRKSETEGCVIPHDIAERIGLLKELQAKFPDLDDEKIIEAMGCTSDNKFVLWKKQVQSQ